MPMARSDAATTSTAGSAAEASTPHDDSRAGEESITMIDSKQEQAGTPRLKKDGTPDRRGGKPGNAGNKHATGRKALPGQELRKTVGYYASKDEAACLKIYIKLLHKNLTIIEKVNADLGTPPPDGTPAPPRKRKTWTCKLLESERDPVKRALTIIKDRLQASKIILESYL
jgi:hypothetical protein